MSKEYTKITAQEFEDFLGVGENGKPIPNDKKWNFWRLSLEGVNESVYGMIVDKDVTLRIYSTIEKGVSREKGADAIRCVLFWRSPSEEIKLVGIEKKVLRIETWRKNLQNRIENWKELSGPKCPKCGSPTIKRKNRKSGNYFYGCVQYPECQSTVRIENAE